MNAIESAVLSACQAPRAYPAIEAAVAKEIGALPVFEPGITLARLVARGRGHQHENGIWTQFWPIYCVDLKRARRAGRARRTVAV